MVDVCTMIYKALEEDLTNISIYNSPVAPDPSEYNRITMFEIENSDINFADDEPFGASVIVRLDVWTKSNDANEMFTIPKAIKKILKGAFVCVRFVIGQTMIEENDKDTVYHKPVDVIVDIELEELQWQLSV